MTWDEPDTTTAAPTAKPSQTRRFVVLGLVLAVAGGRLWLGLEQRADVEVAWSAR